MPETSYFRRKAFWGTAPLTVSAEEPRKGRDPHSVLSYPKLPNPHKLGSVRCQAYKTNEMFVLHSCEKPVLCPVNR